MVLWGTINLGHSMQALIEIANWRFYDESLFND